MGCINGSRVMDIFRYAYDLGTPPPIFRYAYDLGTPPPILRASRVDEGVRGVWHWNDYCVHPFEECSDGNSVAQWQESRGITILYLKDQVLTECLDDRYLRHTITADLRDDNDFERQLRVLDAQWNMLENCMCVVKMWRCTSLRPTLNLCINCPPMVELQ